MPDRVSRVNPGVNHNLTSPLHGAVQAYAHEKINVVRRDATFDYRQQMSVVELSLSTLAHIEHPCAIGDRLGLPPEHVIPDFEIPSTGAVLPCVLIDISGHYQQIEFSGEGPDRVTETASYIEKLKITREQLEFLVDFPDVNPFVLFYTGWRLFAPYRGDLAQATRYFPWHRYYLHPYLDQEVVQYLLLDEEGPRACGIGCDVYTLNHPLGDLYATEPYLGWVADILKSQDIARLVQALGLPDPPGQQVEERQVCWALYSVTAQKGFWLLEQYHMPTELLAQLLEASAHVKYGFPCTVGNLWLVPHTTSPGGQGILVHPIFAAGEWAI